MKISKLKDVIYELVNVAEYEFTPTYFKNIDNACVEICEKLDKLADYEDKQEQGLLIELPVAIGSTVYVITKCGNIKTVMDGNYETATGYYCPYELCDECPHDCYDCEDVKNELAVFEDTIKYIGYDETGIHLFTEDTGMCCTIGKDTFFTRSEAEEALAKMNGEDA